jgi:hypothetical protein
MSGKNMKYEKSKCQLEIMEKEFKAELIPRLEATAGGKESLLFCTSELNQFRQVRPPAESDRLFETAKAIVNLRTELVVTSEGTNLATAFMDSCKEYNDIKNEHRRGPVKLAASLLKAVKEDGWPKE